MRWTPDHVAAAVRAVGEPLLALALASLATGLLTLPFIPISSTAEVRVAGAEGRPRDVAERRLLRQLERQGLPAAGVDLVTRGGDKRVLLIRGLTGEQVEAVRDVVAAEGLDADAVIVRRTADFERMLRGDPATLPTMLTIQAVIFLLLGAALARTRVDASGSPRAGHLRAGLIGLAAGIAAVLLSALISSLLRALGLPVEEQAWLTELFADPRALLRIALWVVLIGPIAEEVFFRAYVMRFITQTIGFPAGLVLSSLMFAAIHFNLSGLLVYLAIGVVLGWAYRHTRNLVAPIVGHVVTNGIVLAVSGFAANLEGGPGL